MVAMTGTPSSAPISGRQYELSYGDYTAVIASVGASVRVLRHRDRDLVVPYPADVVRPFFRGATLAPWPNRVVDGRYLDADGAAHQLALTEPARGHALHGLVVWQDFAAIEVAADRVSLSAALPAQDGYPHPFSVEVGFVLGPDGLTTTVTGTNLGGDTAPWGTAPHPYLVAGAGVVDDWTLELPAAEVLTVTDDRLIPLDLVPVGSLSDGVFDFRRARLIGDTFVDHAFTGLGSVPADGTAQQPEAGRTTVNLRTADGSGVAMAFGPECPWVQIHTADQPEARLSRLGLAVEPMTCAPDAFNSGLGLALLGPGEQHTARWTISALAAATSPVVPIRSA